MNEANLESLARAMSQNTRSVTMKSCFESVRTPATRKSNHSQLSRISAKSAMGGYNTITKDWYKDGGQQRDIYSNFSKMTNQTYKSI
jgi:hypothetical protein